MRRCFSRTRRGFTLVELLFVIGIIAVLIAILLPSLTAARRAADRTKCLANIRSLAMAQMLFAAQNKNALVDADEDAFAPQGSWIGTLQSYAATALVRRCPSDKSVYFDEPFVSPPKSAYRLTSYAISNYLSYTHVPTGYPPLNKITQVRRSAEIVQFVELAEGGNYAVADHVHMSEVYSKFSPQVVTLNQINGQMPVGRHGGRAKGWDGVLNYSFVDGHAESLPLRDVYTDIRTNRFNPFPERVPASAVQDSPE